MMRKNALLMFFAMISMCLPLGAQWQRFNRQPWEKGAFETRQYRNLFVEMGYSPKAVEDKAMGKLTDRQIDRTYG